MDKRTIFAGVILVVVGCNSPVSNTPVSSGGVPKASTALVMPDDLKHDAYHYYGLDMTGTINMELRLADGKVLTGTQSSKLESVGNGSATFFIDRTGGLEEKAGDETVRVDRDGVWVVKNSLGAFKSKSVDLPASLTVGKTWTTEHTLTLPDGQAILEKSRWKVARPEKANTKVGEFDALLLTSSTDATVGNQKVQLESKYWMVKSRGAVKATIKPLGAEGAKGSVVIEEVP